MSVPLAVDRIRDGERALQDGAEHLRRAGLNKEAAFVETVAHLVSFERTWLSERA